MDPAQDLISFNTNPAYPCDDAEANAAMYGRKGRIYNESAALPNPNAKLPLLLLEDMDHKTTEETNKAKETPEKVSKKDSPEEISKSKHIPEKNNITKHAPKKISKKKAAKAKVFEEKASTHQQQRKEKDRELLGLFKGSTEEAKVEEGLFSTGNRFSMLARSEEA